MLAISKEPKSAVTAAGASARATSADSSPSWRNSERPRSDAHRCRPNAEGPSPASACARSSRARSASRSAKRSARADPRRRRHRERAPLRSEAGDAARDPAGAARQRDEEALGRAAQVVRERLAGDVAEDVEGRLAVESSSTQCPETRVTTSGSVIGRQPWLSPDPCGPRERQARDRKRRSPRGGRRRRGAGGRALPAPRRRRRRSRGRARRAPSTRRRADRVPSGSAKTTTRSDSPSDRASRASTSSPIASGRVVPADREAERRRRRRSRGRRSPDRRPGLEVRRRPRRGRAARGDRAGAEHWRAPRPRRAARSTGPAAKRSAASARVATRGLARARRRPGRRAGGVRSRRRARRRRSDHGGQHRVRDVARVGFPRRTGSARMPPPRRPIPSLARQLLRKCPLGINRPPGKPGLAVADYERIERESDLEALSRDLLREKVIAVDTEADSFYHYFDKICLVQIGDAQRDLPGRPARARRPRRARAARARCSRRRRSARSSTPPSTTSSC